jgi:RimJ/RimL family protein N-acetyltransferase
VKKRPRSPPYELRTPRLSLRALEPHHARELRALTSRSADHLRPWLTWAGELPFSLDRLLEVLREMRAAFDRGSDFNFGIFERASGALVGGIGLHPRIGKGALEIGYWIAREATRRGFAREATAAVARAGLTWFGAARLEVRVQPENAASLPIPERLGFRREGLRRGTLAWTDGGWRDQVVFGLLRAELEASPFAGLEVEAFDALGRPLAAGVRGARGPAKRPTA